MCPPPTRRQILASGVAGAVTILAGCSTLSSEPTVSLSQGFVIENYTRDSATIHVEISTNEESRYDRDHEVDAAVYDTSDSTYPSRTSGYRVDIAEWRDETAPYTLRATLDDGTATETDIAEEWSKDCVLPQIRLRQWGVEIVRWSCTMEADSSTATPDAES